MKLVWAFFGLAVIMAVAYTLNRGVNVGYTVTEDPDPAPCAPSYRMDCRYLYPSGFSYLATHSGDTKEDAAKGTCPFFHPN
jgi:hypothetical protein